MSNKNLRTVSDYIAEFIAINDSKAVFQLSGGMITFMIDAIARLGVTPIINNRHEQASGFAAEGATRVSDIPSFAFGTSGPGATNLITPIASCFFDSVPVIFITGQVNTAELRIDKKQRQNGFQELDISTIVKSITKKTYSPKNPLELISALEDGWNLSQQGRKGPVLIDVTINLQQEQIDLTPKRITLKRTKTVIKKRKYEKLNTYLSQSKKPLILVGGGVRLDNAVDALSNFVNRHQIPVVRSLMGIDSFNNTSDFDLGFIGSYGNRWANKALKDSDLLIVLGSRLDIRQTGNSVSEFKKNKKIIRVDIDPKELSGRVSSDLEFEMSICDFLESEYIVKNVVSTQNFIKEINLQKINFPQHLEQESKLTLNPTNLFDWLGRVFSNTNGFVVDVGQHQMWAAQSINLHEGQRFITSGGLGAMGFALPVSIGATLAKSGKWVCVLGDGCFQLSTQELQTIKHYQLPIAICVINNNQHGMVAQFQSENLDSRFIGTRIGYSVPDLERISKAYGFENYHQISKFEDLDSIELVLNNWDDGPIFLEFKIQNSAMALPKLTFKK